MINADFLELLLEKYAANSIMHITDKHTRILASTDSSLVGTNCSTAQYIIQVMHPAVIENKERGESSVYGTPVFLDGELYGTVVVHGPETAVQQGVAVRAALEAAIAYERHSHALSNSDERGQIVKLMLSSQVDKEKLISMMNRQEIDPFRLRCVICIRLDFHQTSYFNINLSLGYQSSIEIVRKEATLQLSSNRYLNTQDLVFIHDRNTIVVIKSFIDVPDHSRVYLALDKICGEFIRDLSNFASFSYSIAYGNLYLSVGDLKKSFEEACEIIHIGKKARSAERLYVLENVLLDSIYHYLHPQFLKKLLYPTLKKLGKKDGSTRTELLDCAEHYIDHCMNISTASEKSLLHRNTIRTRMEKLRDLTGLDPTKSFDDAFIIKMLAVHMRQSRL